MGIALVLGDFYESFVSFLLAMRDVHVVRASTIGFDIFAIDSKGDTFPEKKIVGPKTKNTSKPHLFPLNHNPTSQFNHIHTGSPQNSSAHK